MRNITKVKSTKYLRFGGGDKKEEDSEDDDTSKPTDAGN